MEQIIQDVSAIYDKRTAENASTQIEYFGRCLPGVLDSAAGWQIKKITYFASGNVASEMTANGTQTFDKVWDDRATYTYL